MWSLLQLFSTWAASTASTSLPLQGALPLGVDVLHELLRDRRAALRPPRQQVDGGRAREADRVDRPVLVEALVLDRDDRLLHDLRDLVGLDELAVLVRRAQDREHGVPVSGVDHAVRSRARLERVEVLHVLRDRRGEAVERRDDREREPEEPEHDPSRPATARALRRRGCGGREAEGRRRPGCRSASQQCGWAGREIRGPGPEGESSRCVEGVLGDNACTSGRPGARRASTRMG